MNGAGEVSPGDLVVQSLIRLGVPGPAAEAYGCMLSTGAVKPSAVAAALGVSRGEAYRRLADLSAQGLVSATLTGPLTYLPAEPREVLDTLYLRSKRLVNCLREERERLEPVLRRLRAPPAAGYETTVRVMSGRERAYEHLHEMLSGATQEVLVLNSHPAAAQLAAETGLWQRAQQRADVGIQIRILMKKTAATLRHASALRGIDCQVRVIDLDRIIWYCIVDQKAMLFFARIDPSPRIGVDDSAISTTAAAFLQMEKALFWRLWDEAEPVNGS